MASPTDARPALDALTATTTNSDASNLRIAAVQMANASVLQALVEMTALSHFVAPWRMARTDHRARATHAIAKMDGKASIVTSAPQMMPAMP